MPTSPVARCSCRPTACAGRSPGRSCHRKTPPRSGKTAAPATTTRFSKTVRATTAAACSRTAPISARGANRSGFSRPTTATTPAQISTTNPPSRSAAAVSAFSISTTSPRRRRGSSSSKAATTSTGSACRHARICSNLARPAATTAAALTSASRNRFSLVMSFVITTTRPPIVTMPPTPVATPRNAPHSRTRPSAKIASSANKPNTTAPSPRSPSCARAAACF